MPEILTEFLNWYLAPWRRIGRKEFGIALTVATIPGLLIMVFGWGNSAGNFLEPLMSLGGLTGQVNDAMNVNAGNVPIGIEGLYNSLGSSASATPAEATPGMDWSAVVNGLCLLALLPLGRMRLRDMGWMGRQEILLTVAFNVSVVEGLILSLTGIDVLPMGMLWSFLNFGGYAWLSFAKSKQRTPMHERIADPWRNPMNPDASRKDHDDSY